MHLLANPEKYHNRQVTLVGFINLEFEGNALYMSENQFRLRASHDALWLDVAHMGIKPPFQKGYVIVEGSFNGERRGHFGMFAGTLENIKRLESWRQGRLSN